MGPHILCNRNGPSGGVGAVVESAKVNTNLQVLCVLGVSKAWLDFDARRGEMRLKQASVAPVGICQRFVMRFGDTEEDSKCFLM